MIKNCTNCYYCKHIALKGYEILHLDCKQNITINTTLDQMECSSWKIGDYKPVYLEEAENVDFDEFNIIE